MTKREQITKTLSEVFNAGRQSTASFADLESAGYIDCKVNEILAVRKAKNSVGAYIDNLAAIITSETGYNPFEDMKTRKRERVQSRQILMTLLYSAGKGMSLYDTGRVMGKDHATVIHAQNTVRNLYETDKGFRELFNCIQQRAKQIQ